MNGLLERQQTSGNDWGPPSSSQVYFQQQAGLDRKQAATPVQVSDFAAFEAQMTEHTEEFRRILKDLQRQFIVNDPQSVEAFLKSHRASASTLIESVPYLAESFGPNTPLALEIMAEDGPPTTIYALAIWRDDRIEARSALQRFDETWWLKNLKKAGGRIVFDYELVS
jgi:hypothetical protein